MAILPSPSHTTRHTGPYSAVRVALPNAPMPLDAPCRHSCRHERRFLSNKCKLLYNVCQFARAFITVSIEPGSTVVTDAWTGYSGLQALGYNNRIMTFSKRRKTPSDLFPHVYRNVSSMKRWLMETPQWAVSHDQLDYYLDEFTFRFNRHTSMYRVKLYYQLLEQAVQTPPSSYENMIKHVRGLSRVKHDPWGLPERRGYSS